MILWLFVLVQKWLVRVPCRWWNSVYAFSEPSESNTFAWSFNENKELNQSLNSRYWGMDCTHYRRNCRVFPTHFWRTVVLWEETTSLNSIRFRTIQEQRNRTRTNQQNTPLLATVHQTLSGRIKTRLSKIRDRIVLTTANSWKLRRQEEQCYDDEVLRES